MYLSRLIINPKDRIAQRDLSNLYELHRTIMAAFAGRDAGRVLFRVEGVGSHGIIVLVQSEIEPDWNKVIVSPTYFLNIPESKAFDTSFKTGDLLRFRLKANPTVKRDGKRFGLFNEEEQLAWLMRKGMDHGFSVLSAKSIKEGLRDGNKPGEVMLRFFSVRFDGVLRVDDPVKFKDAVYYGIGSGKGFGHGLLSIAIMR